jgi:hypothetical protein
VNERYDVEAVLRERSGSLPLPPVSWVGRDAYGDVFRSPVWSLAPEIREDLHALLTWLAAHPRRRWANEGRGRADRLLRGYELGERMDAAEQRARRAARRAGVAG